MTSVLLTGASGFIGRQAITPLLEHGYTVHTISTQPCLADTRVQWHIGNLLDPTCAPDLLAEIRPSHLLHFAWYAEPVRYWTSPLNVDWIRASLNLLEAFASHGGQRVLMAGTCAEYDWTTSYSAVTEDTTPLIPTTPYGQCKHALQLALNAFATSRHLSAAWGRIFFLFGPYEAPTRLVPSVINALLKREPVLCSHGEQLRDFLHVTDVAESFVALLNSTATGAVNMGSGQAVALRDVINMLAAELAEPALVRFGARPAPVGEPARLVANVRRLTDEVRWRPRYTLAAGLQQTIAWWKQHETNH